MAAEASRSSGSADSYVGSLISLTSKSEIRYEGVLFNINTEEASIGLRNVRSFGTEGRRKDGPQVPAIDKVYEYIVFRGSDIKDLQVKSSPPVQAAPAVHNDPAIIQSHYAAPSAPSSLPSASTTATTATTGPIPDFNSQMPHPGIPRAPYQDNIPLYQPGGGLASWSPSPPPATNGSGLPVSMYWQGYYRPSGALQPQQQSLIRPVQGLSMPPSMLPPSAQYPPMPSSLPSGNSNVSASMDLPPQLLQPIVSSTVNMQSSMLPVQSSSLIQDSSTNVMPTMAPTQGGPAVSLTSNLPSVSPALSNVLDKSNVASLVPNQAKPFSGSPSMPSNSLSQPMSTIGGVSSSPALVTPGQFLHPGLTTSQTPQTGQKDVEVLQAPSSVSLPQPTPQAAAKAESSEAQGPLLPLPSSPSNPKINGGSYTHYINRGGRGRGRGNELANSMTSFTEDFDFEAMNEKFKKEEVWGHLGKSKVVADDSVYSRDEDEVDVQIDSKPVYKKDDFFDTLSCNALDRNSHNGRPRFSEQIRLDTETFGDFPRNRGYRGGRGPGGGRGGRSRGYGYGGRGYGDGGRGRGNIYRPI